MKIKRYLPLLVFVIALPVCGNTYSQNEERLLREGMEKSCSRSVVTFSHGQFKKHYDNELSIENSPTTKRPPSHQLTASCSSDASVVINDSIREYSKYLARISHEKVA